jgi:hypothetical protein
LCVGGGVPGVGEVAFDRAGDDAESGEVEGESCGLEEEGSVLGFPPEFHQFAVGMVQAISREVAGKLDLLFAREVGYWRQRFGEPVDDAVDDLADAGDGDAELGSGGAERNARDTHGFIDFEISLAGRKKGTVDSGVMWLLLFKEINVGAQFGESGDEVQGIFLQARGQGTS